MRLKPMLLLALASGCGLVAMFLFQQATKGNSAGTVDEKISVLVVTSEITPGTLLSKQNVEFRDYPVSVVPENVVTLPEEFEERASRVRAFPGDFVTLDKLSGKGDHAASQDIPTGMVACTILVDPAMTSSGLLLPGDRVDLLVTFTMRGQYGGGKVIKTVLEFVEVFSVDQRREILTVKGEAAAKTCTLLVDRDQAMLVKLAEDIGKLHLTMRSKTDSESHVSDKDRFKPTDMSDLLGTDDDEEEEKNSTESEDKVEPTNDDDLTQFLDANSQPEPLPVSVPIVPVTVAPLAVQAAEPEADAFDPTWTIEIFAGDIKRVEEVQIPKSEWPIVEPKKDTETVDESGGNPLLKGLKTLFGGEAKKDKSGSENLKTEQPETLPAVDDDQNVEDSIPVPAELKTGN
ncbi:MAG: Flp pilus assembly protein CpaB [Planctomycetota bacterium]|nr:Flp pilus assembly protein CpaB [Planctomycetota bacterium]MDA0921904.1 Flp pilus assembly protein CpaB [Planctomycetota bacterium]